MKTAGVIAEYNPFHNGHKYHLEQTRQITGADYVIAVISGNFTQRGLPAVIDKYSRAKMALLCGADAVFELPVFFAAGSAEFFAAGAVALLDKLGEVNTLCFGSEIGDLSLLSEIADILNQEPVSYKEELKNKIKEGLSYPKARALSLNNYIENNILTNSSADISAGHILIRPNNILGIEYLRALQQRNSLICPYTISRQGASYHDKALSEEIWKNNASRSSASAIRSLLESGISIDEIKGHVPKEVYEILSSHFKKSFPVSGADFSLLLKYKLLSEAKEGYTRYMDVTPDISDKIKKNLNHYTSLEGFCGLLKSKDLTYTRISRILFHILLNITKDKMTSYIESDYISYARILGFRKSAAPLLHAIKQNTSVPVIAKLADAAGLLNASALSMLEDDIWASHVYDSVVSDLYSVPFVNEYSKQIIIL